MADIGNATGSALSSRHVTLPVRGLPRAPRWGSAAAWRAGNVHIDPRVFHDDTFSRNG